jgi:hypothetical protein
MIIFGIKIMKELIYISIYDEDNFVGVSLPIEYKSLIENHNMIDQLFEDYDLYRDYEVEVSQYARHGSIGTKKLETLEDIKKYFKIT